MYKERSRSLHKRTKSEIETPKEEKKTGIKFLIQEADQDIQQYDFLRAAHVYRKILMIYSQKKVQDHKILSPIYLKTGHAYTQFGLFYRALEYYELYTRPFEKHLEDLDSVEHAQIFFLMAENSLREERYFEARDNFLKTISIWEKEASDHSLKLAQTYEKISEAFAGLKQFENSFKSLKRAKDIFEGLGLKDQSLCLSSYAKVYAFMGDIEKSYQYYQLYFKFEINTKEDKRELAWIYQNYALILMNKSEMDEAQKYLELCTSLRKTMYNRTGHYEIGRSFISWVPFHLFNNDLDSAIKSCQEAQVQNKELYGDYHFETAEVYKYLGIILQKKAKFQEGLEYYSKVIEIKSTIFGPNHYQMADIYSLMAEAHSVNVQDKQAKSFYKKALKSLKPWFGDKHPDVANFHMLIALHEKQKNVKSMVKSLKAALDTLLLCIKQSVFDTAYSFNFDNLNRVIKIHPNLLEALKPYIQKVATEIEQLSDDDVQYGQHIINSLRKMNPEEKYVLQKKASNAVRTPNRFYTTISSLKKTSSMPKQESKKNFNFKIQLPK